MKVVQNLSSCLQVVPARFRVTRKSFLVLALVIIPSMWVSYFRDWCRMTPSLGLN